jgi:hypothetical protein
MPSDTAIGTLISTSASTAANRISMMAMSNPAQWVASTAGTV